MEWNDESADWIKVTGICGFWMGAAMTKYAVPGSRGMESLERFFMGISSPLFVSGRRGTTYV